MMTRDWRVRRAQRVKTPRPLFSRRSDYSSKSPQMPIAVGGPPDEGGDMTWRCVATAGAVAERERRISRFTQNNQLGSAVLIVLFSTVITKVSVKPSEKRWKTINLGWGGRSLLYECWQLWRVKK